MHKTSPSLSVIIITRNEESNLYECLKSLNEFADEVIVVDSRSTDKTVEIALQFNATVLQPDDWPGYGPQKNRALDLATGDWVFSIDADERVTAELGLEIKAIIQASINDHQSTAYQISRLSWYCGRFIRYSGWQPDYVLRLFKRGTAKFSDDLVHERVITEQPVASLKNQLIHYSYKDFTQVLSKVDIYSSAWAKQAHARGKKSSLSKALGHGAWAFIRTFILRAGFLDGSYGFALSISNAETSYYKYLKLWQIQEIEKRNHSKSN